LIAAQASRANDQGTTDEGHAETRSRHGRRESALRAARQKVPPVVGFIPTWSAIRSARSRQILKSQRSAGRARRRHPVAGGVIHLVIEARRTGVWIVRHRPSSADHIR